MKSKNKLNIKKALKVDKDIIKYIKAYKDDLYGQNNRKLEELLDTNTEINIGKNSTVVNNISLKELPYKVISFVGSSIGELAGFSAAICGDVNGKGEPDYIIGATNANNGKGRVYIIYGENNFQPGEKVKLNEIGTKNYGIIIDGVEELGQFGFSVSGGVDVNGDSIDDFIISAPFANVNNIAGAGIVYVLYGNSNSQEMSQIRLSSLHEFEGFKIKGSSTDGNSGYSVELINENNIVSALIGAPYESYNKKILNGLTYQVYISKNQQDINLNEIKNNPQLGNIISGEDSLDYAGSSVKDIGDINKDGYNDYAISAYLSDSNGQIDNGTVYIIYGNKDGKSPDINKNLANLSSDKGFRITGAVSSDNNGFSVTKIGDFNGDGIADVAIGAPEASPHVNGEVRSEAGTTYIIYGKNNDSSGNKPFLDINLGNLTIEDGIKIYGPYAGARSGFDVSGFGDVNDQGPNDILIAIPGSTQLTKFILIYGSTNPQNIDLKNLLVSQGAIISFANQKNMESNASAGVVSSSGDVLFCSSTGDTNGSDSGECFLFQKADDPTNQPTNQPSGQPSSNPSAHPSGVPSAQPSGVPSSQPSSVPSAQPSGVPSSQPSEIPSAQPSGVPSSQPSGVPSAQPSEVPSSQPSSVPSSQPSVQPTLSPTFNPYATPCFNEEGKQIGDRLYVDHNGDGYLDVMCKNYDGSFEYYEFRAGFLIKMGPLTSTNSTSIETVGNSTTIEDQSF